MRYVVWFTCLVVVLLFWKLGPFTSSERITAVSGEISAKVLKGHEEAAISQADKFLKAVDACAVKVGLPQGSGAPAKAEWESPANQESLRGCLAEKGFDTKAASEDKLRDLRELSSCVKKRSGVELPHPKDWGRLPPEVKAAARECRNVLKGWLIQSQLDRLLNPPGSSPPAPVFPSKPPR